jgi:hypothetical protein
MPRIRTKSGNQPAFRALILFFDFDSDPDFDLDAPKQTLTS